MLLFCYSRLSRVCLSHLYEPYETHSLMRNFFDPFVTYTGESTVQEDLRKSLFLNVLKFLFFYIPLNSTDYRLLNQLHITLYFQVFTALLQKQRKFSSN
jgi:hypothetical protein